MTGRPEIGLTDRPLTPEEIQKAAYQFLPGTPLVDSEHEFKEIGDVVESFITPEPTNFNSRTYPAGTWFMTARVTDPTIRDGVITKQFKGFSVAALPERFREMLMAKGMFSDVKEKEWFPIAVSIVKLPFYPDMIFKVFRADEFIKKNFPKEEVDKLTDKEDSGAMAIIGKFFDYLINKEAKAPTDELYENGLETKVGKLKQQLEDAEKENKKLTKKLEKLEKKMETKDEDKEEDKKDAKDKKDDKKDDKEAKDEDKEEENEDKEAKDDKKDDEVIKKSLNIDEAKAAGRKGFMEEIGCDSMGRNKKYL
jgi:hypothetical protein